MMGQFEYINYFEYPELNLGFVLAIHSYGSKGIAIGGCRRIKYSSLSKAIEDAKKLAFNMTLKYKVVELNYGGCKIIIYSFDEAYKSESFKKIGSVLNLFRGKVYIATDVGTSIEDMNLIEQESSYVIESTKRLINCESPILLLTSGVILCLKAAMDFKYGSSSFLMKRCFVLGLGKSGLEIAKSILKEGGEVFGFDQDSKKNDVARELGVKIVEDYWTDNYDIFIPCAYGEIFNDQTLNLVNFKIFGGSANFPLNLEQEKYLRSKGVIVIPDFIISSGTIVLDEFLLRDELSSLNGEKKLNLIYDMTKRFLKLQKNKEIYSNDFAKILIKNQNVT